MSLLDELAKEELPRSCCSLGEWLSEAGLTEDDRRAFDQWVSSGKSRTALWRACQRMGFQGGRTTLIAHVRDHVS